MYATFSLTERERESTDADLRAAGPHPVYRWRALGEAGGWSSAGGEDGAQRSPSASASASELGSVSASASASDLEVLERSLAAAGPLDAVPPLSEAVATGQWFTVSDPRGGCSGLVVARPGRADVVLNGTDEGALRGAVEQLMDVLGARGRNSPGDSVVWDARGRPRADGRVRVLTTAGLYGYAARHGAPLVLWIITLALALVSVLIAASVGENSSQGWLADWAHATLDRVFTGALGAALVASVMAGRQLQRGTGRRRRQALVHWTEREGASR